MEFFCRILPSKSLVGKHVVSSFPFLLQFPVLDPAMVLFSHPADYSWLEQEMDICQDSLS